MRKEQGTISQIITIESNNFKAVGNYIRPLPNSGIAEHFGHTKDHNAQAYIIPANKPDSPALKIGGSTYTLQELADALGVNLDRFNQGSNPEDELEEWLTHRSKYFSNLLNRHPELSNQIKRQNYRSPQGEYRAGIRATYFKYCNQKSFIAYLDDGVTKNGSTRTYKSPSQSEIPWHFKTKDYRDGDPCIITDSPKGALAYISSGYSFVCGLSGAGQLTPEQAQWLVRQTSSFIIVTDCTVDERKKALAVGETLNQLGAKQISYYDPNPQWGITKDCPQYGYDETDLLNEKGLEALKQIQYETVDNLIIIDPDRRKVKSEDGPVLQSKDYPEPQWAIPDILPEGLTLLVGRPKMGKSWMALDFCNSIALGSNALGKIPVEKSEAFYISLEDTPRRMKDRTLKINDGKYYPDGTKIHFNFDLPTFDNGGLDQLDAWLDEHSNCKLVVIDTLARVRQLNRGGMNAYDWDTQMASSLQKLAHKHKISLVLVHHTRKGASGDPIEAVNGSQGLAGVADAVLVLDRNRGENDAKLSVMGRDVEEQDLAVKFNSDNCTWELMGESKQYELSLERQAILEVLEESDNAMSPRQIAETLELLPKENSIRHLLCKMYKEGMINKIGRGQYVVNDPIDLQTGKDDLPQTGNDKSFQDLPVSKSINIVHNSDNHISQRDSVVNDQSEQAKISPLVNGTIHNKSESHKKSQPVVNDVSAINQSDTGENISNHSSEDKVHLKHVNQDNAGETIKQLQDKIKKLEDLLKLNGITDITEIQKALQLNGVGHINGKNGFHID